MKEHFFVIGGGDLQLRFIQTVKNSGYICHVFDFNPNCVGKKYADYFHLLSIDDVEGIYSIAKEYKPIAIQTVATELGNITACAIGERLKLRNNTFETALNTTDKSRMKKILNKEGIRTAKSCELYADSNLSSLPLAFPLVVKSSDRSASRGVTFVESQSQFEKAFQIALKESRNKIVLIEEYLEGKQFSVETISSNGVHHIVGVTEEYTDGIPNFVESHHLMPARLAREELTCLTALVNKILNAFNIKFGASHIELKYNKGEWAVIELASRMGGWRDVMTTVSMGIDYLKMIIDVAVGKQISINPLFHKYVIVRMILNQKDYLLYYYFKQNYPDHIYFENVTLTDKEFQATTLMESRGFYYLVAETLEQANEFMNHE